MVPHWFNFNQKGEHMKVSSETSSKKFKPVAITITLETEKEFNDFQEMVRFTDSIPEMLEREHAQCDHLACGNTLSRIYHALQDSK